MWYAYQSLLARSQVTVLSQRSIPPVHASIMVQADMRETLESYSQTLLHMRFFLFSEYYDKLLASLGRCSQKGTLRTAPISKKYCRELLSLTWG